MLCVENFNKAPKIKELRRREKGTKPVSYTKEENAINCWTISEIGLVCILFGFGV